MFGGKSEELIRLLRRAVIAKKTIQVFKPSIDNRYAEHKVVSHSKSELPAANVPMDNPDFILHSNNEWFYRHHPVTLTMEWCWDADVVGIDETQFFGPRIINVVDELVDMGRQVIVAGLDLDYRAEPFGPMPILMAKADQITRLTAICTVCGRPAIRTQRLTESSECVEIGGPDKYAARCRLHFTPGPQG